MDKIDKLTMKLLDYILDNQVRNLDNFYNNNNIDNINFSYIYKIIKDIKSMNSSCYHFIGYIYHYGKDVEKNYYKAIKFYNKAIETHSKNSSAMNDLAIMYRYGRGVRIDYNMAIELFHKAIGLNNSNAMFNLALMYKRGKGVEQDYNKAIKLYEMAIKLNNSYAMNELGIIYQYGLGVEINYCKTRELYGYAIELNNPRAMINLAHIYEYGLGVNKDNSNAIKLYGEAIKLQNLNALNYLLEMEDLTIKDRRQIVCLYNSIKDIVNDYIKIKLEEYISKNINTLDIILYCLELQEKCDTLEEQHKYAPGYGEYYLKGQEEYYRLEKQRKDEITKI